MTDHEITQLFAVLAIEYPQNPNDELRMQLWRQVLADVPAQAVQGALTVWLRDPEKARFCPRPGELRALAIEATACIPQPEIAWGEVMREIRRVGSLGTPEFSCPEIAKAVRTMGWRELCRSEEIGIERAHFFRVFGAYRSRALRDEPFPGAIGPGSRVGILGELVGAPSK